MMSLTNAHVAAMGLAGSREPDHPCSGPRRARPTRSPSRAPKRALRPASSLTPAWDDEQEHWSRRLLRDETSVPPLPIEAPLAIELDDDQQP